MQKQDSKNHLKAMEVPDKASLKPKMDEATKGDGSQKSEAIDAPQEALDLQAETQVSVEGNMASMAPADDALLVRLKVVTRTKPEKQGDMAFRHQRATEGIQIDLQKAPGL